MSKLVLIDEYFANRVGHYYEYNKSVKEIYETTGNPCVIYAKNNLPADISAEVGAIPLFKPLEKNGLNKIPVVGQLINRSKFWRALYKDIQEIYRREKDPDTVFFFTTVVWYNVLPVALAAAKSNRRNILLYRLSIFEHAGLSNSLKSAGDWLYKYTFGKLAGNKQVRYCTDSDVIAEECNRVYSCNMKVLPIPHVKDDYPSSLDASGQMPENEFIVYAPGAIREEKGIEFIVTGFEHMAQKYPDLCKKMVLVTQYNDKADKALNDNVRGRLSKLPIKNIFLGNLSTEEYTSQLSNCHIVLIPYSVAHGYRARTSGIMSETIAACKPFITTKGSWMEIQGTKYQTGESVAYNDNEAMVKTLEQITQQYPSYKQKANTAKPKWLAYHSTENFKKLLLELIN